MSADRTPRLRHQRDFQLLWFGQSISALGSRVTGIALPLLVLAETDSPARAGLVAFAFGLPLFVFTLRAGAFIDRWDRRAVMLAADSARLLAPAVSRSPCSRASSAAPSGTRRRRFPQRPEQQRAPRIRTARRSSAV